MRLALLILAGKNSPHKSRQGVTNQDTEQHPAQQLDRTYLRVNDQALIERNLESFSTQFEDIFIAGASEDYRRLKGRLNVRDILDYGYIPVGTRLRKSLEALRSSGHDRVVITTCDILPSPDDIAKVLDRYRQLCQQDDVAILLPYCQTPPEGFLGKQAYLFKQKEGTISYGAVGHFWPVDSTKMRLPFVEWLLNACYLRRCPVRADDSVTAEGIMQRQIFLRETRSTFYEYLWKAWKKQVENEGCLFTYRYALTLMHVIRYVRGGLNMIESQEAVLQKALIHPDSFKHDKRQVAIELLDIRSLAEDIDGMQDWDRVRFRLQNHNAPATRARGAGSTVDFKGRS